MEFISRPRSGSAQLLRELAAASPTLVASNKVVAWGLQAHGAINGGPKISNFEQTRKFREANIPTPDAQREIPTINPTLWIGREDSHTRGRDIKFSNKRGFNESNYFVKLIPQPSEEWRITIAFGRAIARGKKIPGPRTTSDIIRNRTKGWVLDHTIDPPEGIRTAAKNAIKALGYDFGSVDIIYKDGVAYVLEVNKASGLDSYTATAYIRALERHVNETR